ncbi:MAG TPA: CHAT domain-containing protein, partial [Candidatus Angelobacter sp.]
MVKADSRLRLWCLALKGYTDLDLDTKSAKRSWTEALGIAEGLGEAQWASRAKGELGVIAFLEGNPTRAVSLVGQALLSLVASKDAAGEARLLTMLGDGYNEVHRFAEADWFFQRAISIMESTPDAAFPFNAEVGDAQALAGEGHQAQAEELLAKLLSRAKREKKSWHETDALIALGELAIKAQDMERARGFLERAGELSKIFHLYRDQAMVMIDLAGVYRIQGNLKSADAAVKVGLAASRHVGDRYYLPRNLTAAAELKVAENEPKQADLLFEEAEDVIDGMLLNQHTDYGKAALAGSMSETYLKHFHLVQEQGNVARALHLLERVRGRASASRLYEPRDSTSDSPARAALEANIAAVQVSLLATEDQKARLALQDQLLQNERTLAFEDNELPRTQWSWLAPASLVSVQKVLRKDELLLEYVLDDPHAFCIAVTANDARIIQLPAGSRQIQDLTASYLRELKARSSSQRLASDLYTVLLKDATQAFHQARLIVVPDGILNFLPFEALTGADGKFIVSSTVVSYVPSATALWVLRTAKTGPASRPLLAIGDVDYADRRVSREPRPSPSWAPAVLRDLAELSSSHLQNLPESRQEVLSIARIAGSDSQVLLGRDATETAFKAQPISQYRVVHLAVHAIADSQYPDRSALVLAADNPPEDGLLQVREITRLHLNADLVTLSACQTGVGPTEGEAGAISLEQAFLMAGAKAVVA